MSQPALSLAGQIVLVSVICLAGTFTASILAAPTTDIDARFAVQSWLRLDRTPLNTPLPATVAEVNTYSDKQNQPLYHVVALNPTGFVIVAGDDRVPPILGFVAEGTYDPSASNPVGGLVSRDLPARVGIHRDSPPAPKASVRQAADNAQRLWDMLLAGGVMARGSGIASVDDVRIAPLVASEWNQGNALGNICYNYYTPNNYVCGCVATAIGQIMRYHEYPTTGVGTGSFTISVDDMARTASLRGGDGAGGPYAWDQMVLVPGDAGSLTETQRQAIGALCYDVGVASSMMYSASGSGAYTSSATDALRNVFGYANAIYAHNSDWSDITSDATDMINPCLDAGYPVYVAFETATADAAHALICDGYGYQLSTLYHHLNLGWGGAKDAWYALPDIDTDYYVFNSVFDVVYNVFPEITGEIVSGRVLDSSSQPLSGATVTGVVDGVGTFTDTTDAQGIYALAGITSGTSCTITVTLADYSFDPQTLSVGTSVTDTPQTGNRWAIDFTASTPRPPTVEDVPVETTAGSKVSIMLDAHDDGLPDPPGALTCIITSLPTVGTLSDPHVGAIDTVPYTLTDGGNEVTYTASDDVSGNDMFTYKADDGGTAPTGGDSDEATVTITILAEPAIVIEPNTLTLVCGNDENEPAPDSPAAGPRTIDIHIIDGRPPKDRRAPVATLPTVPRAGEANILTDVPAFDWSFGCAATAGAMMAGFYDRHGYPDSYIGTANNGICPLANDGNPIGSSEHCALAATELGLDGRTVRGHVDDYWISYLNSDDDPWITNTWTEHAYADCTGDFMGTNQSSLGNADGSTSLVFYTDGSAIHDFDGWEDFRDGGHGLKLFFESRGYEVMDTYNQYIQGVGSDPALGFTFEQFQAEIDAGRPVLIHVQGHTMLGFGYDVEQTLVYLHDTWDHQSHSMTWGGSYEGMDHQGVTVIQLGSGQVGGCLTIGNNGGSDLIVEAITGMPEWATLSMPLPYTVPAGMEATACLQATCDTCFNEDLEAAIQVHSNDPVNPQYPVSIMLDCPTCAPPMVEAGDDQTIAYPTAEVALTGSASDDGCPRSGELAISWSLLEGPATVTFADVSAAQTTASFTQAGTYVLQLEADDSLDVSADTVTIIVEEPQLQVSPTEVGADILDETQPTTELILTVTNAGTGTLDFEVVPSDSVWIADITPLTGSVSGDSADVTLQIDATGLDEGVYDGTIMIQSQSFELQSVAVAIDLVVDYPEPDADGDGTPDLSDNCPEVANTDQLDTDADTIGDACDNCPELANTDQADIDDDGFGDACDNCPETANAEQTDSDADAIGDACDNCPVTANTDQGDADGNGIGDACEPEPHAPDEGDESGEDTDDGDSDTNTGNDSNTDSDTDNEGGTGSDASGDTGTDSAGEQDDTSDPQPTDDSTDTDDSDSNDDVVSDDTDDDQVLDEHPENPNDVGPNGTTSAPALCGAMTPPALMMGMLGMMMLRLTARSRRVGRFR